MAHMTHTRDWRCRHCTFESSPDRLTCEMCSKPRHASKYGLGGMGPTANMGPAFGSGYRQRKGQGQGHSHVQGRGRGISGGGGGGRRSPAQWRRAGGAGGTAPTRGQGQPGGPVLYSTPAQPQSLPRSQTQTQTQTQTQPVSWWAWISGRESTEVGSQSQGQGQGQSWSAMAAAISSRTNWDSAGQKGVDSQYTP